MTSFLWSVSVLNLDEAVLVTSFLWSVSVLNLDEAVLVTSFLWSVSVLNLDEVELSGPLPRFLPTPTFYSVTVGDTAILECAVVELDDKKVLL